MGALMASARYQEERTGGVSMCFDRLEWSGKGLLWGIPAGVDRISDETSAMGWGIWIDDVATSVDRHVVVIPAQGREVVEIVASAV